MKATLLAIVACGALAACTTPSSRVSTTPVSGITSSNGGGQRELGNTQSIGVTTPTGRGY
jgi:hypothetical protein